ncbi:hypothetical protein [Pseudoneobacillus sp. C159]
MALWWITAISMVMCLGFIGGAFAYGLKGALQSDDSTKIDPLPNDKN